MDIIESLLEALEVSPQNIPLRLQVADMMLQQGRNEEAANQYKFILNIKADHKRAQAGLGTAYYQQQKFSAAIVVFEQIEALGLPERLLYIKSLIKENSISQAVEAHQALMEMYPGFSDEEIDKVLRIPASPDEMEGLFDDFEDDEEYFMEKPTTKFADVGGMKKVKEEISIKIIQPLKNPELYKAFGKKSGGGILLYGPPGCGKTFIAKATAGEIDARFINIGLHDILDMWIGNSEKNLHDVFELARRSAPCVLFFDEADALGGSRSDMKQSAMRHVINQFLAELDGVDADNEGVLVLAATNAPWNIDAAFRRPGRFDRVIFVGPPDDEAREDILKSLLQDKPAVDIDTRKIAAVTADYSGADLNAIIDIAVEEKLWESISKGSVQPIHTKDLLNAVKKHQPTTKEWFASARNYALYSNESGVYDDILKYLKIKK